MIKILVAAALALTLAACSAPESPKAVRSSDGKVALPVAPPPPLVAEDRMMCPADVKMCSDGSYVSRNANNGCAFARCPGETQP